MKIVLTGGGSGGHITPILAVAHELKKLLPDSHIIYIGQRGDDLLDIVQKNRSIDSVETISAGKLRRYSNEGWRQLLDLPTQLLNIRDVLRTIRGLGQSYFLLKRIQPAVVFTRGGFVSVPVGLAAKLRHVPYITHDADSVPSLANRLIARWAQLHAVALPIETYPYPPAKTVMVGIPSDHHYQPLSEAQVQAYKRQIGLEAYKHVLLASGGGNGARALNLALVRNTRYLLATFPDLAIVHIAGRSLEKETVDAYDELGLGSARKRLLVFGFLTDMYRYSGAADVVLVRGGAASIAEMALQAKPCLIIPSKQLSWNVKNSHVLCEMGATKELDEDQAEQPERLGRAIGHLIKHEKERQALANNLAKLARPAAAHDLAKIIVAIGQGKR